MTDKTATVTVGPDKSGQTATATVTPEDVENLRARGKNDQADRLEAEIKRQGGKK